jgi:hypothetical protein
VGVPFVGAAGGSVGAAGAAPTTGSPRGCVVVRLRAVGVAKSPPEIPIGPLRSPRGGRATTDRARGGGVTVGGGVAWLSRFS